MKPAVLTRKLLLLTCLLCLHACGDPATQESEDAGHCGSADAITPDVAVDQSGPKYLQTIANWTEYDALADISDSDAGRIHSLKFLILDVATDPKLYFIHRRFALHYDFGHFLLPTLFPTRNIFDSIVYPAPSQPHPHVVGTLLWYEQLTVPPGHLPLGAQAPVTLQFFSTDAMTVPLVLATYAALLPHLAYLPAQGAQQRLIYTPSSGVQEGLALANEATLTAAGVPWLQQADLLAGVQQQAMNPGLTFGTLRAVAWDNLGAGSVSYRDVVVLERLPLDLPLVGGTITAELQTPLAHVNVAAKTRGTPNLALRNALTDPRVQPLLGKPVRFEVLAGGFTLREATLAEVDTYWKDRQACRVAFKAKADLTVFGVHDMEAEGFGFKDSTRFGVKASNYAELRRAFTLHEKSKPGFFAHINQGLDNFTTPSLAVAFAEYDRHIHSSPVVASDCAGMAIVCPEAGDVDAATCVRAKTVCEAVVKANKPKDLAAYIHTVLGRSDFAADSPLRAALLHGFRWKIEKTPVDAKFGAELDAAIAKRFGAETVRLRSSTNAEDLRGFTGAGLYESFSATASGPKRASLRIVKTWGSVWTFRAFEERSFWNIDHESVYMGVQINPAFPEEVANGVLVTRNLVQPTGWGFYLNAQKGEESVTNPTNGITAEVLTTTWGWTPSTCATSKCPIWKSTCGTYDPKCEGVPIPFVTRQAWSSLSPGVPLLTDAEVGVLTQAVLIAQDHLAPMYGATPADIAFELEWKVYGPKRQIYLKQIRPY